MQAQVLRSLQLLPTLLCCGASAGRVPAVQELQQLQLECVTTLRYMVNRLDRRKLILCPGAFWAAVGLMHAPGRRMYEAAVLLFEDLLGALDLADACTQNVLFSHCPQDWSPVFPAPPNPAPCIHSHARTQLLADALPSDRTHACPRLDTHAHTHTHTHTPPTRRTTG